MNVLSLFDGISTGRLALQRAGITVDSYYASEIDQKAIKISRANWSDVIQIGDIEKIDLESLPKIDLLIGGSPCQGFSRAGKGLNFDDPRSRLFFKYVEVLEGPKKKNPDIKFLLENVNMAHEWRDIITQYLGVEPVLINSRKVSAALRERLYWTNIWEVSQPEDKGVRLLDIIDRNVEISEPVKKDGILFDPYFSENARNLVYVENGEIRIRQATKQGYIVAENGDGINISFPLSKSRRGRVIKQKAPTMTCVCNFGCLIDGVIRRFTAEELERLQTLPDGYTKYYKEDDGELAEVPRSARESVIGNGWTTDVIVHILKGILPHKEEPEPEIPKADRAQIHDDCLEYELEIISAAEELTERRLIAYKSGKIESFKTIISLLESIKQGAEIYKEYLDELDQKEGSHL